VGSWQIENKGGRFREFFNDAEHRTSISLCLLMMKKWKAGVSRILIPDERGIRVSGVWPDVFQSRIPESMLQLYLGLRKTDARGFQNQGRQKQQPACGPQFIKVYIPILDLASRDLLIESGLYLQIRTRICKSLAVSLRIYGTPESGRSAVLKLRHANQSALSGS